MILSVRLITTTSTVRARALPARRLRRFTARPSAPTRNSNRVAAILYGPKSVVVVCGVNKLVKNIDEAVERVKTKAAPPNTVRLGIDTYCAKAGQCVSMNKENPELCEGCHGDGRICCNYVVCAQQRHVNRIKVIIINEELGY